MKRKTIIRLGAIFFVLASAGVMADEFRLAPTEVAIGTMFFALLFGAGSLAVFLWRAAGWWAAGLGMVGVLAIVASNLFYPTDLFAWMFSLGVLCVGLALLPAGPLARLTGEQVADTAFAQQQRRDQGVVERDQQLPDGVDDGP